MVSYLTCILIEGNFASRNQHPCTFLLFQLRVLQCSRCTRKCRCTSHTLTLDESNSKLSVENYGLIRAAEDVVYVF